MRKKIIFIEPYASLGGHMWANVNYFQSCIHGENVPYAFIIEKDLEVANSGYLDRSLINNVELIHQTEALRMSTRAKEYSAIVRRGKQSVCVFLSNYDFDLTVWRSLFKDEGWRKRTLKDDTVIVIHVTVLTFTLLNLFEDCRGELSELSKNVFFSFFSELQPLIVRQVAKTNNCLTLFRVGDEGWAQNKHYNDRTATYLSLLGIYSTTKNPQVVIEAHRAFKDERFQIQFYPLAGNNAALFSALLREKRSFDRIICKQMSADDYVYAINSTKIGLLPYHGYKYAAQASGLLEDYMFAGIPTIVPQDTWLSYFQALFNGGGLTFDPDKTGDFETQTQNVIDDYSEHQERAVRAALFISKERNARKYLDILYALDDTRICNVDDINAGMPGVKKAVQKGMAYLFTQCAEESYRANKILQARQFIHNALAADQHYWEADYVKKRLFSVGTFQSITTIRGALSFSGVNPYQCLSSIRKDRSFYDKDTYEAELKKIINEVQWQNYIAFEEIEVLLTAIRVESLLDIDSWEALGNGVLLANDEKRIIVKMIIKIGELLKGKGHHAWPTFFKRAISLLEEKEKDHEEMYWLASAYEKMQQNRKAEQLFLLLSEKAEAKIAGGALFHLGSMALDSEREELARNYFTQCLNIYPQHGRAREILYDFMTTPRALCKHIPSVPILFLIYNRPEVTQQVFDAIRFVRPKTLFISADGPRAGGEGLCQKTRDVVSKIDWDCNVHRLYRESNSGCRQAVSTGINWFFEHVEEGIILEDDTVPHPSFFKYCEELLAHYRNDTRIMHIAGTNKGYNADMPHSYYFSQYAPIWGWATWRRAWKLYDGEMNHWPQIRDRLHHFVSNGESCEMRRCNFDYVYEGNVDTWDYQWHLTVLMQHGLAVVPRVNLISNIGFGDIATHTKNVASPVASLLTFEMDHPLQHPPYMTYYEPFESYHLSNQ